MKLFQISMLIGALVCVSNGYSVLVRKDLYERLDIPVQEFVKDYVKWPQQEQEKIFVSEVGYSYMFKSFVSKDISAKYNSNLGVWLDTQLDFDQIIPFVVIMRDIQAALHVKRLDDNQPLFEVIENYYEE